MKTKVKKSILSYRQPGERIAYIPAGRAYPQYLNDDPHHATIPSRRLCSWDTLPWVKVRESEIFHLRLNQNIARLMALICRQRG